MTKRALKVSLILNLPYVITLAGLTLMAVALIRLTYNS